MPMVRYDDRSYYLDDRRIWLTSGSIHYFRIPHQLWRDRLLKAKRAGLNCVQTHVAWNLHEPVEGQWDFSGQCDLPAFVELAGELGLYVILRPGPFIGAQWDFGGLPGWLATKSNISYRGTNATYLHYFDKYLRQVLPRLADMQVTRGGNIVLIQNENDYVHATMPDRANYCEFISQLYRRAGFEIPIITCNRCSEPQIADTIECYGGWGREIQDLKRLRLFQPGAPMLATDFRVGTADHWGGEHGRHDARATARRAMEILGCGCQINYYMWAGGTNFGFWGGQLASHQAAYQTTSYDYDAPLAEGGGLTEKYYLARLVNMLSTHFGWVFAQARMETPGLTVHKAPAALNLVGPRGRVAIVTGGGEDVEEATVSLPDGRDLTVPLAPLGATAVLMDVFMGDDRVLDYASFMPLGILAEDHLVLHGPAGWEGRISINGQELRCTVPDGEEPRLFEHGGQKILLLNSDLAQRTWEVDGAVLMGPAFVGETANDIIPLSGATQYAILTADGQLTHKKIKTRPARKPLAPRLGSFTRLSVCAEPIDADLPWQKLDRPADLAACGAPRGYGWYRLQVESPRALRRQLFMPDCEDRALVYVNRRMVCTWGRGQDATREPVGISLKRGANELLFLADNLGRPDFGPHSVRPKGIFGQVWDAKPLRLKKFKVSPDAEFSRRMVPRSMAHLIGELQAATMWRAEVTIPLTKILPVHLSYSDLPHHVLVVCNGRQVGFFPKTGGDGQVTLANELQRGNNKLKLLIWGDLDPAALNKVKAYSLVESISAQGEWSWRPWEVPTERGRVVGKELPAWYHCRFHYKPTPTPLFLKINGARKGQVFLNGHNLGRFWNIGPQQFYYLPEPWLTDENELLIFEEQGRIPSGSKLEFRPRGPYRD